MVLYYNQLCDKRQWHVSARDGVGIHIVVSVWGGAVKAMPLTGVEHTYDKL